MHNFLKYFKDSLNFKRKKRNFEDLPKGQSLIKLPENRIISPIPGETEVETNERIALTDKYRENFLNFLKQVWKHSEVQKYFGNSRKETTLQDSPHHEAFNFLMNTIASSIYTCLELPDKIKVKITSEIESIAVENHELPLPSLEGFNIYLFYQYLKLNK